METDIGYIDAGTFNTITVPTYGYTIGTTGTVFHDTGVTAEELSANLQNFWDLMNDHGITINRDALFRHVGSNDTEEPPHKRNEEDYEPEDLDILYDNMVM